MTHHIKVPSKGGFEYTVKIERVEQGGSEESYDLICIQVPVKGEVPAKGGKGGYGSGGYAEPGFELTAETTTDATGSWPNCDRKDAWSEWSRATAPDGYAIDRDTLKYDWIGQNGSENNYELTYDDWVAVNPVNPAFQSPRTVNLRVHARSPEGCNSGRGWSKLRVTGQFQRYK